MIRKFLLSFSILFLLLSALAREGMWIPILLDRNIEEMKQMGFQLSVDDVYSVNHASMKDAIVLFGRGCTGEMISPEGLLITNHHCGFNQIQSHSSVDNDYLTDGFWAMDRDEELLNPGLAVTFLVEMREVTDEVFEGADTLIIETDIQDKIRENIAILTNEAINGTHYEASVKPFYEGNQYYLFITEKFTDVRLVGAPPSSIGKFGGDTDNWMWPRHTGDFALFRIYAGADNKPADYSPANVPYQSKTYFPINVSGVEAGDFTMVFGYPGTTQQFLYSEAVNQVIEQRNPDRIAIRDIKLDIMSRAMEDDRAIRIQYAAKYASASNAWKKWQGERNGLIRLNAVEVKKQQEAVFNQWVEQLPERKQKYGSVLSEFEKQYAALLPYQKAKDYFNEILQNGTDSYRIYNQYARLIRNKTKLNVKEETTFITNHYKDYNFLVDRDIFLALFNKYYHHMEQSFLPDYFKEIFDKKETQKYLNDIYSNSLLNNPNAMISLISKGDVDKIQKQLNNDKLFVFFDSFISHYYESLFNNFTQISNQIARNQKLYVEALLEKGDNEMLFPDANLTMRVAYGKVEGYRPADGIKYKHYTTLSGIMEKDNPDIYDYKVPAKLKELYRKDEYGRYANSTGELPVCFLASNHTTGGNSGSPVINANGHLIGINFDRAWEGTMSDIMFDPEKCRNISVDMRYVLFLIDQFAGAGYLLNEMQIVN